MFRYLIFIIGFLYAINLQAQELLVPQKRIIYAKLGSSTVPIEVSKYGNISQPVFINLHDDETTALRAAEKLLENKGGLLIHLVNNNERNIRFRLDGRNYEVDPNRIFSRRGIIESLSDFGRMSKKAVVQLEQLAARIVQLFPVKPGSIIALHNNKDGDFSVRDFLPGKSRARDAAKIHIAPGQDDDDVFLTTDSSLYRKLVRQQYNVILQDNRRATKDGSLSVYCGERRIRYLNCETEHDKFTQYQQMLEAAAEHIY